MKSLYFLYGSILMLVVNDLFLVTKPQEITHSVLYFVMLVVFVVALIVWLSRDVPWREKLVNGILGFALIVLYFNASNRIDKASLDMWFGFKQKQYDELSRHIANEVNVVYRAEKAAGKERVFLPDIYDSLTNDVTIREKMDFLGVWAYDIHEINQGEYEIELTLINGREVMGLIYNTTGGVPPDNTATVGKIRWKKSGFWLMWRKPATSFITPG